MSYPRKPCIAVAQFIHETVSFLAQDTVLADFVYPGSPARGEALLHYAPGSYIDGFVRMAREMRDVELLGIQSPLHSRNATGSGWIQKEAFETLLAQMADDLAAKGRVDGLYLALHGAMAVRGVARPEAEIAARLRAVVGPDVPIVATFDLHGNEDAAFLDHADMGFAVKYYPHYDEFDQGARAARHLVAMIEKRYRPVHATRKVPLLTPTVAQWTGGEAWMALGQRALIWEARQRDVVCNIFFGFPWADVPDTGMTVQVFTDGDEELARQICADLCAFAWRSREALAGAGDVTSIAGGLDRAADLAGRRRQPVVIGDHSDRSGAATQVLSETIRRDIPRVLTATLRDEAVVTRLISADIQPGAPFDETVGGRIDPSAGEPVRIIGRVLAVGHGKGQSGHWFDTTNEPFIAVAHGNGSVLVLTGTLVQVLEPDALRHYGIDPAEFDLILLKSRVHFRRGFMDSGFAEHAILVEPDEPFLGTTKLLGLSYTAIDPMDFYPLNPDVEFDPAG